MNADESLTLPTLITSLRYTMKHTDTKDVSSSTSFRLIKRHRILLSPSALLPPSAGLPHPDAAELPQPGHAVRPEGAATGGGARRGEARGPGGVSAGGGAEIGMREAERGDETAAEQSEGEGELV